MTSLPKVLALGCAMLAAASGVQAQPTARLPVVGIVSPLSAPPDPPTVRAFKEELRGLGYEEGRNIVVEARYANGHDERFPALFAELIGRKADVLVAGTSVGAIAAKKATTSIPIVFAGLVDPVSTGVVASFARPGGNVTGATFGVGGAGVGGKWVELLAQAVPGARHLAVLLNPDDPQTPALLREIDSAAQALRVRVSRFEVREAASLGKAIADVAASGAQGMIVPNHPTFAANRAKLVRLVAAKRLPAIYFFNLFPEAGGLMSYGGNVEDSYRRAADYVVRILKGAKPADLPVNQPTKFELIINLRAAKEIGLSIPRTLLQRADRVIE